jgi:uncharacterized protein with HEPN domain
MTITKEQIEMPRREESKTEQPRPLLNYPAILETFLTQLEENNFFDIESVRNLYSSIQRTRLISNQKKWNLLNNYHEVFPIQIALVIERAITFNQEHWPTELVRLARNCSYLLLEIKQIGKTLSEIKSAAKDNEKVKKTFHKTFHKTLQRVHAAINRNEFPQKYIKQLLIELIEFIEASGNIRDDNSATRIECLAAIKARLLRSNTILEKRWRGHVCRRLINAYEQNASKQIGVSIQYTTAENLSNESYSEDDANFAFRMIAVLLMEGIAKKLDFKEPGYSIDEPEEVISFCYQVVDDLNYAHYSLLPAEASEHTEISFTDHLFRELTHKESQVTMIKDLMSRTELKSTFHPSFSSAASLKEQIFELKKIKACLLQLQTLADECASDSRLIKEATELLFNTLLAVDCFKQGRNTPEENHLARLAATLEEDIFNSAKSLIKKLPQSININNLEVFVSSLTYQTFNLSQQFVDVLDMTYSRVEAKTPQIALEEYIFSSEHDSPLFKLLLKHSEKQVSLHTLLALIRDIESCEPEVVKQRKAMFATLMHAEISLNSYASLREFLDSFLTSPSREIAPYINDLNKLIRATPTSRLHDLISCLLLINYQDECNLDRLQRRIEHLPFIPERLRELFQAEATEEQLDSLVNIIKTVCTFSSYIDNAAALTATFNSNIDNAASFTATLNLLLNLRPNEHLTTHKSFKTISVIYPALCYLTKRDYETNGRERDCYLAEANKVFNLFVDGSYLDLGELLLYLYQQEKGALFDCPQNALTASFICDVYCYNSRLIADNESLVQIQSGYEVIKGKAKAYSKLFRLLFQHSEEAPNPTLPFMMLMNHDRYFPNGFIDYAELEDSPLDSPSFLTFIHDPLVNQLKTNAGLLYKFFKASLMLTRKILNSLEEVSEKHKEALLALSSLLDKFELAELMSINTDEENGWLLEKLISEENTIAINHCLRNSPRFFRTITQIAGREKILQLINSIKIAQTRPDHVFLLNIIKQLNKPEDRVHRSKLTKAFFNTQSTRLVTSWLEEQSSEDLELCFKLLCEAEEQEKLLEILTNSPRFREANLEQIPNFMLSILSNKKNARLFQDQLSTLLEELCKQFDSDQVMRILISKNEKGNNCFHLLSRSAANLYSALPNAIVNHEQLKTVLLEEKNDKGKTPIELLFERLQKICAQVEPEKAKEREIKISFINHLFLTNRNRQFLIDEDPLLLITGETAIAAGKNKNWNNYCETQKSCDELKAMKFFQFSALKKSNERILIVKADDKNKAGINHLYSAAGANLDKCCLIQIDGERFLVGFISETTRYQFQLLELHLALKKRKQKKNPQQKPKRHIKKSKSLNWGKKNKTATAKPKTPPRKRTTSQKGTWSQGERAPTRRQLKKQQNLQKAAEQEKRKIAQARRKAAKANPTVESDEEGKPSSRLFSTLVNSRTDAAAGATAIMDRAGAGAGAGGARAGAGGAGAGAGIHIVGNDDGRKPSDLLTAVMQLPDHMHPSVLTRPSQMLEAGLFPNRQGRPRRAFQLQQEHIPYLELLEVCLRFVPTSRGEETYQVHTPGSSTTEEAYLKLLYPAARLALIRFFEFKKAAGNQFDFIRNKLVHHWASPCETPSIEKAKKLFQIVLEIRNLYRDKNNCKAYCNFLPEALSKKIESELEFTEANHSETEEEVLIQLEQAFSALDATVKLAQTMKNCNLKRIDSWNREDKTQHCLAAQYHILVIGEKLKKLSIKQIKKIHPGLEIIHRQLRMARNQLAHEAEESMGTTLSRQQQSAITQLIMHLTEIRKNMTKLNTVTNHRVASLS